MTPATEKEIGEWEQLCDLDADDPALPPLEFCRLISSLRVEREVSSQLRAALEGMVEAAERFKTGDLSRGGGADLANAYRALAVASYPLNEDATEGAK